MTDRSARASLAGCLAALAWLAAPTPAQQAEDPPAEHRLTLEAGALAQGLEDPLASPLRYRGTSPAFAAGYEWAGERWRWDARVAGARHDMRSAISAEEAGTEETAWLSATAALGRRVGAPLRGLTLWAGPALAFHGQVRRHTYTPGIWLNFTDGLLALQAAARADLDLGRWGEVAGSVGVPLVGVAHRVEYPGLASRPPEVTVALPPSFLLVTNRLEYRLPLAGRWAARAFQELAFARTRGPGDLETVTQRFGLGVTWRWSRP